MIVFLHASPSYNPHTDPDLRFADDVIVLHKGDAPTARVLPGLFLYNKGVKLKLWMTEPGGYDLEPWDACDMVVLLADRSDFQPGKVAMRGLLDQAMRKGKTTHVIFGD